MTPVLILPGIGGSDPEHWQSRWEVLEPSHRRIEMPDWNRPELEEWLRVLDAAVKQAPAAPVIVAHSLGCLAVVHWASRGGWARAAMLVAVPDPAGLEFPALARSFGQLPLRPLPFSTRVVASRNDSYASFEFAANCARAWGSELSDIGNAGHINSESGLGDWPAGQQLLAGLLGAAEAVVFQ
jgi:predicted alpha/beta hydrolase family esterase